MLIIFGIYAMYSNYNGQGCALDTINCYSSYQTLYSFYNVISNKRVESYQQALSLGVIIGLILLMQLMRYYIRKVGQECDERDTSASDYTLFVEHIETNLNIDYVKELKEFFETVPIPNNTQIFVEKICLAYDIRSLPE